MFGDELIDEHADIVGALVAGGKPLTQVRTMLRLMKVPDDLIELSIARHETRMLSINGLSLVIDPESPHAPWYPGPQQKDRFWPPVLAELQTRLPSTAVEDVDKVTNAIMSQLRAPGTESFSTRGLVLGYVQSGKTTNFMALAAKAADAGYKLIVILSGLTDILRNQTQDRVDEVVWAGSNDWYRLTKPGADFAESGDAAPLFAQYNGALIAVVKKNPARLRRLRDWIRSAGTVAQKHAPMLLIDDEADQASINVGDVRRSTINSLLREILMHPRSAYVAYTATPFANLLINPKDDTDLYPRDFVISMPRPQGYFGPERLFGDFTDPDDPGLDVIRRIAAAEALEAKPPSGAGAVAKWHPVGGDALRRALLWFLVATAARRARHDKTSHSSMLVHTSMLSEAHFRTKNAIQAIIDPVRRGVATSDESVLRDLRELWQSETLRVPAEEFDNQHVSWAQVRSELPAVLGDVQLVVDNYKSDDRLKYPKDEPTTVIVIGGNTLSRGLTLEGLTSSYFVRSASAYDTLLQMGRWFGYRHGYEDLCRVWITDELKNWFRSLSEVEAEIREEIARYALERISPLEMGVRIRLHPDLAVTEAAKMRHAIPASLSYDGRAPQTTLFRRLDGHRLNQNFEATKALFDEINRTGGVVSSFKQGKTLNGQAKGYLDVSAELVRRFLTRYVFDENQAGISASLLDKYIDGELQHAALEKWRVVILGGPTGEVHKLPGVGQITGAIRSRISEGDDALANIRALTSAAERVTGIDWHEGESAPSTVTELKKLRNDRHPGEGILRIYVIDRASVPKPSQSGRIALDAAGPVIGVQFDFPRSADPEAGVEYVVADIPVGVDVEIANDVDEADEADEERL